MGLTTTAVPRPTDRLIVLILLFDEDFCYDFDTTARSEYGQKKREGRASIIPGWLGGEHLRGMVVWRRRRWGGHRWWFLSWLSTCSLFASILVCLIFRKPSCYQVFGRVCLSSSSELDACDLGWCFRVVLTVATVGTMQQMDQV